MHAFAAVLCLGLVASALGANTVTTTLGGIVDGTNEVLGSLCFAAGTKSTITIHINNYASSGKDTTRILFYDDQAGSFDAIGKVGQTCAERESFSKFLCNGEGLQKKCQAGYRVGVDPNPQSIGITESIPRQWYFVAVDCGAADAMKWSYNIMSDDAIDCDTMHLDEDGHSGGYVVAVVFLVIFVAILAATTVIFYRKSQGGVYNAAMPENYEQL